MTQVVAGNRRIPLPLQLILVAALLGVVSQVSGQVLNAATRQHPGAEMPPSSAPAGAQDLRSYAANLDSWLASIGELESPEASTPERIAELRRSLRKEWVVRVGDRSLVVSMAWLDDELQKIEKRPKARVALLKGIRARLQAMHAEAELLLRSEEQAGGASAVSNARSRLQDILSRREFRSVRQPTWFDRVREAIAMWLRELFGKLFGQLSRFPGVGELLVWGLIGVTLALVVIWVRRIIVSGAREPELDLKHSLPAGLTWQKWARQAREAAGRGAYREAIHHLYWAAIYRLEELGAWKLDRTRTHREYLRLLPATHEHHAHLSDVTRRFEATWYGGQAATAREFEETVTRLENLGCGTS